MINLAEYLTNLEDLGLIKSKNSTSEGGYAFTHVFTQESVYDSLLRSDRRRLHLLVGEALEELLPQQHDDADIVLMLAYHFEQAKDTQRALKYLRQAANGAAAAYANREAQALYKRALTLIPSSDYVARWEILSRQEQILDRLGERDKQADLLIQMQTLAQLEEDDYRLTITHNRRVAYFDKISEYRAAAEAAEVGLWVARRSGNEHLQAECLNLLALAAWRRFDYREVQKWARQALDALKIVGDPMVRITSLFHLGKASYRLGQYDQALYFIQGTQELTQDIDNRDAEATSHLILGWIYQRLGKYGLAEEHFQAKLEIRRSIGDRYGEANALSHLGWLAFDQQKPDVGLEYCRQALEISQTINDRENEAYALSGMGLNCEALNHLDSAAANYQTALAIHNEIGSSTLAVFDQAGLARISLAQGDREEAGKQIKVVANWVLSGNAQKFWDPWIIYRSGINVLNALGQSDTARTILTEAHSVLHQRANEISDDQLRDRFLTNVAVNKEIEQTWHALHMGEHA